MKSVLISIQPKWVEKIANGEKTIEVRKTAPKCEVPFKCYIYCTSSDVHSALVVGDGDAKLIHCCNYKNAIPVGGAIGNGKVIGEFVCDGIAEFESEFHDDNSTEQLRRVWYDEDDGERDAELFAEDGDPNYLCTDACLTWYELKNYVGIGDRTFYGLHISELKIYDKPKELGEFYRPCSYSGICYSCNRFRPNGTPNDKPNDFCDSTITRAPQSWQYVEEL